MSSSGKEPATFFRTKINHALNVTLFLDVCNIVQWSSFKMKYKNPKYNAFKKTTRERKWNYVLNPQLSVLLRFFL
jgi:hypothetical protein